jgi:hypothetical protein
MPLQLAETMVQQPASYTQASNIMVPQYSCPPTVTNNVTEDTIYCPPIFDMCRTEVDPNMGPWVIRTLPTGPWGSIPLTHTW